MKILDVEDFHSGLREIEATLSSQKDQVDQIEKAVTDVVNLDDSLKGEGGDAIRDFYRGNHLPMLEKYQLFLSDYQSVLRQMKEALYSLEPSPAGFIRQSFLESDVEQGVHRASQSTIDLTSEANATVRSVSDIISLPRLQDASFLQQASIAQREKERSIEKLFEFDHVQTASLSSLEKQVHSMTQEIAQLHTVFQEGKLGIIEKNKKISLDESSFLSKLSEYASVKLSQKFSQLLGTLEGSIFAVVDIVTGLADSLIALFTDPIGFFKGIINTVLHPIDTAKYIWKDLKQSFEEDVVNGDVRSRARYFSYTGTYIAASIFGTKGIDKVGKLGKAGNSKPDLPYNVITTAKIKSFIQNGVKSTFGKVEDTVHNLLSSRSGKRAMELNRLSSHLGDLFRKTKNVLNPDKIKAAFDKTYQKVAAGPISKVAQADVFSRMGRVLFNENGHVVVSGKGKVSQGERVDGGTEGKSVLNKDLAKTYLRDIEAKTGRNINKEQIHLIKEALRNKKYEKLTPIETAKHRSKFTSSLKDKLIAEWEEKTKQKWPRYTEEVLDKNGEVARSIGQPFDAHHIIENNFGGPHEWWNVHPAKYPDEHQAGIHGKGAPSGKLFPRR
ncbi:T7SS effector LXG polymorphic toxin [Bacillus sp. P14.5]|uniref:ribonuclease YeeF family protein n=1 Tax=Bacillus sp. P14.5 TaxID=1983400 RepID=UPI0013B066BB|nr:T7SS effector LXG polymorphic toxin [Bacillus sp. P14.5]